MGCPAEPGTQAETARAGKGVPESRPLTLQPAAEAAECKRERDHAARCRKGVYRWAARRLFSRYSPAASSISSPPPTVNTRVPTPPVCGSSTPAEL